MDIKSHNGPQHIPSANSLKKNPKFFFGFSDPANFLHQPASSLKKNPKKKIGFSDPANFHVCVLTCLPARGGRFQY